MGESTVTRTRHGCLRQSSAFPQRRWDGQLVRGPGVLPGYRATVTLAKPGTIWWHHKSKVHQPSMEGWTSSSWNHSSHTSEVSTGMGNVRWGRIISGLKAQPGRLNSRIWILLGHLLPGWSRGPWFTSQYLSILKQSTAPEQWVCYRAVLRTKWVIILEDTLALRASSIPVNFCFNCRQLASRYTLSIGSNIKTLNQHSGTVF